MEMVAFQEMAPQGCDRRGGLPFWLGRHARTGPASEGVGLVVAYMTHRFGQIEWLQSSKGPYEPFAIKLLPVQRRGPVPGLANGPPIRQPQLGPLIAAIGHKGQVVRIGGQSIG